MATGIDLFADHYLERDPLALEAVLDVLDEQARRQRRESLLDRLRSKVRR